MLTRRYWSSPLLTALLIGCTVVLPTAPGATPVGTPVAPSKTITSHIVIGLDHPLPDLGPWSYAERHGTGAQALDLWHATLGTTDEQGRPVPRLAAALPSLDDGTWRLFPDGSMQTTYRLRPDARWHDGQPLVAADFLVGFDLTTELPPHERPGHLTAAAISRVEAKDTSTLLIHWRDTRPEANAVREALVPYPSHIFDSDAVGPRTQRDHPYWTTDFIGLGPYRVQQFSPGVRITLRAADTYVLGPPQFTSITVDMGRSRSGLLGGLRDGTVDLVLGASWGAVEGVDARAGWGPGDGRLLVTPRTLTIAQFPLGTAGNVPEFRDARFRRALAVAVNRQQTGFAESLGSVPPPGLWTLTSDPRWPDIASAVDDPVAYDPPRAFRLLTEVGWERGPDGRLAKNGQPLVFELRSLNADRTQAILARYWSEIGAQLDLTQATAGEPPPGRPVVLLHAAPPSPPGGFARAFGAAADSRADGTPTFGPESALDPALLLTDRLSAERAAARFVSREVPIVILGWRVQTTPVAGSLAGPRSRSGLDVEPWVLFNVHEWGRS